MTRSRGSSPVDEMSALATGAPGAPGPFSYVGTQRGNIWKQRGVGRYHVRSLGLPAPRTVTNKCCCA